MTLTYKVVVVDAHSEVEAELIAARIVFGGPGTFANVSEYSCLVGFCIYNKMLIEAKAEYEDWIGQFEHNQNGYYERRPAAQKTRDNKAKAKQ